jgi:glutamate synthase (NADPH/NADH) small chain
MSDKGEISKINLQERITTFKEVSRGLTEAEAVREATRCLQCKHAPCSKGCPAGIDVREFILLIRDKKYIEAVAKIREANSLPGVCGRVCPQEEQCQFACVLNKKGTPISIGYLERFVADYYIRTCPIMEKKEPPLGAKKVAVVGAGPAGLTCAGELAKAGFDVSVFEALHKPGGVLVYGIPEFRLPKYIVDREVDYLRSLGVKFFYNYVIGRTKTIDDFRADGFKAFYIAVGAGLPQFLNIPGENLGGVYSANEFLTRVNLMKGYKFPEYDTPVKIGKRVGVFGAGNVAFDCARCALRLGASEVHVIYRRTFDEMPARKEEIENAREEGIKFHLLTSPTSIFANETGDLKGVMCVKNELGVPDASGRRSPIVVANSEFTIELETVIVAVGTTANPLLISTLPGMKLSKRGYIEVNDKFQTSLEDVFAGGDIVSGSATVISAIESARKAAVAIKEYLT